MGLFESCVISARSKAGRIEDSGLLMFESCVISARSKAKQMTDSHEATFESCVISARSKAFTESHGASCGLRAV